MRVLVQPYSHTLSHVSRPLTVALELRSRGCDVIFAGTGSKSSFVQNEGFPIVPSHEPDPEVLYGNIRSRKLKFVSDNMLSELIEDDLRIYKQISPDIVLSDGRFSAPISTAISGRRHIAIVNVSSTPFRANPYVPFFEWVPQNLCFKYGKTKSLLDKLNLKLEMLAFDLAMRTFTHLSKKHNLTNRITATNCLTGKDVTLLADVPEYFPSTNLPANYHYVGPLTLQQHIPTPEWWPIKKAAKPLVYFTMGTTGVEEVFHEVIKLFKRQGIGAVITTGGHNLQADTSDTIQVVDYIDGDLVMDACDVVVCHGGNGTIYQALLHEKPIIGIPTIPDQEFNMRRVESLGLGRKLDFSSVRKSPETLLNAIVNLQSDSLVALHVRQFAKLLGAYDSSRIAADMILTN